MQEVCPALSAKLLHFGILIKSTAQAIVAASNMTYTNSDDLALSTVGIIFLGTPHTGAKVANFAGVLANVATVLLPFKKVNRSLLKTLKKDSELLNKTQISFWQWHEAVRQRHNRQVNVANFYESVPYKFAFKVSHTFTPM